MRKLSNTATPKYYGRFREAVIRGEIPVNEMISLEMNRIDALIKNPGVYYDPLPVEGYIAFCESELTLTDGSDLILLDTFKLWAEQLFCWYYYVEKAVYVPYADKRKGGRFLKRKVLKRLTTRQTIILGRGGAKTLYAETIQAYFLVVDTTTTKQVTMAPTMKQAEEVMSGFRTAIIRSRGPLFKFLTAGSLQNTTGDVAKRKKLSSTKKGIENFLTGSILEVVPMAIDKLQGLRVKVATLDEWLSCKIREDPIGAIEQGASKIDDYVILAISSEGNVRNGVGDTIKMELESILRGEYYNPHHSIFYYRLDSVEEVAYPELWVKAQPNLNYTVSYETYQLEVERAEKSPSTRNDTLAKRFGIPLEGLTYYFTYEETLLHRARNYDGISCSMGCDLSLGDDFCSFTFLFPMHGNNVFGVKNICYITEVTFQNLIPAKREKYSQFIEEGSLFIMPGTILNMEDVYDDLAGHIDSHKYNVECVGYDPYNAKEFVNLWIQDNGEYGIEKVIQGARTESVPLGEIKKLASRRKLFFDQEIYKFCMGNCIVIVDTNGNKKLYRASREEKVDCVASTLDALVAFKLHRDLFDN